MTPSFPLDRLPADDVLTLRPWGAGDAAALTAETGDAERRRWMPHLPEPYTEADGLAFVTAAAAELIAGTGAQLAVTATDGGAVLGGVKLVTLDARRRRGETGYWVLPSRRREGIATRALDLVSTWGLRACGFRRLEAFVAVGNEASLAVARAAGYERRGMLRSFLTRPDGRREDAVVLVREERGPQPR